MGRTASAQWLTGCVQGAGDALIRVLSTGIGEAVADGVGAWVAGDRMVESARGHEQALHSLALDADGEGELDHARVAAMSLSECPARALTSRDP